MKISVLGTFVKDKIIPVQGKVITSLGGIFYTISYLSCLLDKTWQIYPVCFIGNDLYEEIINYFDEYENVKLNGVKAIPQKNTKIKLVYKTEDNREEILRYPLPGLTFEDIKPFLNADILLINFITGQEINLENLKKIRHHSSAIIYLDYHSKALHTDSRGIRNYYQDKNWQQYTEQVDILQMNEKEAHILAGLSKKDELQKLIAFAKKLLKLRLKIINITLGSQGSLLITKSNKKTNVKTVPSYPMKDILDVTGCGDAFSTGFISKYFETKDAHTAAGFANYIAGLNCTIAGVDNIKKIMAGIK